VKRRWLWFVLAILMPLTAYAGEVIFCNKVPGTYTVTCEGVVTQVVVEDIGDGQGVFGVDCASIPQVRMVTGGVSFSCEALDE